MVQLARGVFYSSATYAKRPDVMDLYSKTDMIKAVANPEDLAEAIQRGGVPMQQVVASMLARAGQYLRRERSFAGVKYDAPVVPVNRDSYEGFSASLFDIMEFSKRVQRATLRIADDIRDGAGTIGPDSATGGAGATSTNFTSVMHNLIGQMLLSIKAEQAAQQALDALKAGEKPVVTVANTMESFLNEYAAEEGLEAGADVKLDFGGLLKRYLERTRTITVKRPFQDPEKTYLSDRELGPLGVAAYNKALATIESIDFSALPVSPIDYIHAKLRSAGYKTGEVTGRSTVLDYAFKPDGSIASATLAQRPTTDIKPAGRRLTIRKFNEGGIDMILLNKAGSTGISLHASMFFKDKRKRVMIIAQAEGNIDTHMQMLGRMHRTGQVVLPRYVQLVADVPAEKRPAAVLAKKMASLNASTTANRKGALSSEDTPDFMNQYGDRVAWMLMNEDRDLNTRLGEPVPFGTDDDAPAGVADSMRKVTGRIPLLKLVEQEALYDRLEAEYKGLIANLDATGNNALEAKSLDLDAKPIREQEVRAATGPSPFESAVKLVEYDVKRQGKPISSKDVLAAMAKTLGVEINDGVPATRMFESLARKGEVEAGPRGAEARRDFRAFMNKRLDDIEDVDARDRERVRLSENQDRWVNLHDMMTVGARVRLVTDGGEAVNGVVTKMERGGNTKNPLALSDWRVTLATISDAGMMTMPLSQLQAGEASETRMGVQQVGWEQNVKQTLDLFDRLAEGDMRERRVIATGNILSGFSALQGRGQIVTFRTADDQVIPGILMPRGVTLDDAAGTIRRPLRTGAEVIQAMTEGRVFTSASRDVSLFLDPRNNGALTVQTPRSRAVGGRYFLDPQLRRITGDFYTRGQFMRAEGIPYRQAQDVAQRLIDLGARFTATSNTRAGSTPSGLTPRAQEHWQDIRDGVLERVRRAAGGEVGVYLHAPGSIDADADVRRASAGGDPTGGDLSGLYERDNFADGSVESLIRVAMTKDWRETAYHEAIHHLDAAGKFTAKERAIIRNQWARMTRELVADGMDARRAKGLPPFETLAYYGAMDQMQREEGRKMHPGLRGVLQKIRNLLESVRNFMRGYGFQNLDDVFAKVYSGEIGARPDQGIAGQVESFFRAAAFSRSSLDKIDQLNRQNGMVPPIRPTVVNDYEAPVQSKTANDYTDRFDAIKRMLGQIEAARGSPLPEPLNVYLLARLSADRAGARIEDLGREEVKPILDALKRSDGIDADDLGMFLYARHAGERNALMAQRDPKRFAKDGGSGMATATAQEILDEFLLAGKTPALEAMAARVYAMLRRDLIRRVNAGLLSQETYNQYVSGYKYYVPLRGFGEVSELEDEADGRKVNKGKGFAITKKEYQSALGRTSASNNPLYNTILQAEEGLRRVEDNRVGKAMYRLVKDNKNDDVAKIVSPPMIMKKVLGSDGLVHTVPDLQESRFADDVQRVKIGGKSHFIKYPDPMLAQAMKNLNPVAQEGVLKAVVSGGRIFSQMQTSRNPEFFVSNVSRDVQDALVNLGSLRLRLMPRFLKNLPGALTTAGLNNMGLLKIQNRAIYDEWRLSGGQLHYGGLRDVEQIEAEFLEDLKGKGSAKATAHFMLKAIDGLNDTFESGVRFAAFKSARQQGYSVAQAALISRDATVDFKQRGRVTPLLNGFYPFFNANLRGNINYWNRLKTSNRFRAINAGIVGAGFMATLFNLSFGDDDPDGKKPYTRIKDFDRARNIIFKTGAGQDQFIKIPMGFALQIPWKIGEQMAMVMMGQTTPWKAAGELAMSIATAYNPLGTGSLLNLVSPWMIDPLVDLTRNKNFADRNIHPDDSQWNRGTPESQTYFRGASSASKAVAQGLHDFGWKLAEWTGNGKGSRFEPAPQQIGGWHMFEVHPDSIDYMTGFITGGVGRFIKRSYELVDNIASGVETPDDRIPFKRTFVGSDRGVEAESFYGQKRQLDEKANQYRSARKYADDHPGDQEAKATVSRLSKELKVGRKGRDGDTNDWMNSSVKVMQKASEAVKDLRAEIDSVRQSKTLTAHQRDLRERALEKKIEATMRDARKKAARITKPD
jgi:hypothetical protein